MTIFDRSPAWLIWLLESGVTLGISSLAVRCVSFARLAQIRSSHWPAQPRVAASDLEAAELRRALEAWARRMPWRTLCLEQGLAAHWMLRRRRRASTLSYGAAMIDGQLKAHVWVRSGDQDVVGCGNAADFVLLSQFPPGSSSPSVHS